MKKWLKIIGIILINISIISGAIEMILRIFPQIMPYAQLWNYKQHYSEMFHVLSTPKASNLYLKELNPQILLIGDSFTRGAEVDKYWKCRSI